MHIMSNVYVLIPGIQMADVVRLKPSVLIAAARLVHHRDIDAVEGSVHPKYMPRFMPGEKMRAARYFDRVVAIKIHIA